MSNTNEKFNLWCIVELFGHQKIAGKCTEQNIAGANMLRVDVPETKQQPAFTRFFGSAAIYAINPVSEDIAKHYAESLSVKPIDSYDFNSILKKHNALLAEAPATADTSNNYFPLDDDEIEDYRDDDRRSSYSTH